VIGRLGPRLGPVTCSKATSLPSTRHVWLPRWRELPRPVGCRLRGPQNAGSDHRHLLHRARVGGDGAAVQQVPRFAVGRDCHGGDHAGVEELQALVRRPIHLDVRIGDQHDLRVVDGDPRRSAFGLERHPAVAPRSWRGHGANLYSRVRRALRLSPRAGDIVGRIRLWSGCYEEECGPGPPIRLAAGAAVQVVKDQRVQHGQSDADGSARPTKLVRGRC
jgi:hypothetical protein